MKNILVICLSLLMATACNVQKAEEKPGIGSRADTIETVLPRRMKPSRKINLPGDLRPWEVTNIQPKVKGYVKSVRADRGSLVRRGMVLAVLEAPELHAHLAEVEAKVEDFKSRLLASTATYRRMLKTSKTPGAVAANELEIAKTHMLVDSLQVLSAMASVAAIGEMVNYLIIAAPFDGTVTQRNISVGELVGPDHAKPMFVVENSNVLRLTVAIPEIYSGQLKASEPVIFRVNALPERSFEARLSRSSQSLDFSLRAMMVEFDVLNSDRVLKSGMYAEVILPVERTASTLFVPSSAVVNSTERMFVIVLEDGKAKWVNVTTGIQSEGMVEIFGSLKEGDELVLRASEELRQGTSLIQYRRLTRL